MNETSAIIILFAAILTNNILLTNFLGMCSFIACSGQIRTAIGLGTAVTFVLTMTTMINYVIYHSVLMPLGLDHAFPDDVDFRSIWLRHLLTLLF